MIDRHLLTEKLDESEFARRLPGVLATDAAAEDVLDGLRDFRQEESFLIGLRLLTGDLTPREAGETHSALAASIVRAMLARITGDFETRFGKVPGGRRIILAMGKLGSREMTAASDLDLIVIYDFDAAHPESDGATSLHATHYYTRLSQRLISGLTVATRRGKLYDVDMRLRPSGRQGPLATQFESFLEYQRTEAETWEHMALTRARVIAGDASLATEVEAALRNILAAPPRASLRKDIRDMRRLIAKEKGEDDPLDLKYAPGGQVDLDFLAQYLCLKHAHAAPALLTRAPADIFVRAQSLGFLAPDEATSLLAADEFYAHVTQVQRAILGGDIQLAQASDAVRHRLATALNLPGFGQLEAELFETQAQVRAIFNADVG